MKKGKKIDIKDIIELVEGMDINDNIQIKGWHAVRLVDYTEGYNSALSDIINKLKEYEE